VPPIVARLLALALRTTGEQDGGVGLLVGEDDADVASPRKGKENPEGNAPRRAGDVDVAGDDGREGGSDEGSCAALRVREVDKRQEAPKANHEKA
jgi:hypothetical protein